MSERDPRTGPEEGGADGGPSGEEGPQAGPELARAVLDAARARRPPSRRRDPAADATRTPGGRDGSAARTPRGRDWSGPGPDGRDPQPLGRVIAALVRARGWERPAAEARLFGMWERAVGPEVSSHSRPVMLEDGVLTVEASSTTWATQLRWLAASLLKQIAAEVGHGVVTKLHVRGPSAPSWDKGPRRVRGRGPRDTYG